MERARVIRAQKLNRRTSPEIADNRNGTYALGDQLFKLAEHDGWALVVAVNDFPHNAHSSCYWVSSNYLELIPKGKKNWGSLFTHWPTDSKVVTQPFGARPQVYGQWKLPGHEGLDIRAPHGANIYAVAPGKVYEIKTHTDGHNYGTRIRIEHDSGYKSIYAHLDRVADGLKIGDRVAGGQLIGYADNTGNSNGSHLHLTVKHPDAVPGGNKYIGYPYEIVDPTPLLEHLR